MRIEKNVSERKGKQYSDWKKNRRRQRRVSPVQILYETCKQVFANCGPGVVPSAENIERLKAVLGMLVDSFELIFLSVELLLRHKFAKFHFYYVGQKYKF